MKYPRLIIDTKKIKQNVQTLVKLASSQGIEVAGVTKVFCAQKDVTKSFVDGGVKYLADSRIENMIRLQKFEIPKIFLRLPMQSQIDDVVKYADISLNSDVETIKKLSDSALKQNKVHGVILMMDLGDLREGFYEEEDLYIAIEKIKDLKGIKIIGLGTNLTCYGGVIPTNTNLSRLVKVANEIEKRYSIKLEIVSGGNSSSVHLLGKEKLTGINNLRLGESLVCGTETAYGKRIEGTYNDAFVLELEVIEAKDKPSIPTGEIGRDAFGNVPTYTDRGIRKRIICAAGQQDLDNGTIIPHDDDIIILGGSSDHLILDATDSKLDYKVGDIIKFNLKYASILRAMTSEFVEKVIIWKEGSYDKRQRSYEKIDWRKSKVEVF